MGSLSKTCFFPSKFFLEKKTRIKPRRMFLPEFLLVFRGKKTQTTETTNPQKPWTVAAKLLIQHDPSILAPNLSSLPALPTLYQEHCEERGSHPGPRAVGTGHSWHLQPGQCPTARIWPSPCMALGMDTANNTPSTGIKNVNPLSRANNQTPSPPAAQVTQNKQK